MQIPTSKKYCRSLFWLSRPNDTYPLLPLRGFIALSAAILSIGLVGFIVDKELAALANKETINSKEWVAENKTIDVENHKKILNSFTRPLFRSLGYSPSSMVTGRNRILILGDSYILGDGLTNINMTWWRQTQWELERRGYRNLDVIAAGTNGASTQDEYGWLKSNSLIDAAHPDVIIFGYVTNDPDMKNHAGNRLVKQMPTNGSLGDDASNIFKKLLPNLSLELESRMSGKLHFVPDDSTGYPYGQWELKILEGRNFKEYKNLLKQLSIKLKGIGIPSFFVSTPNYPNRGDFEVRYRPIRDAMQESGLKFYDVLPAFLECCSQIYLSQVSWAASPANGHPGPRATHFYAVQVADILESQYSSVLGRRTPIGQYKPAINDWMPASLNPVANGAGIWTFQYPHNEVDLLFMPIKKRHVALNFERPVSIRGIKLISNTAAEFAVWATVLNEGNYEEKEYVWVGKGEGAEVSIVFDQTLAAKRITSLRISRRPPSLKTIATLDLSKVTHSEGNAYSYPLPEMSGESDTSDTPGRSILLLLENGKPLPLPHSMHDDIRKKGNGRYSHWQQGILFSSSDGSDPRTNGRHYTLSRQTSDPVKLSIDFNSPAVKL